MLLLLMLLLLLVLWLVLLVMGVCIVDGLVVIAAYDLSMQRGKQTRPNGGYPIFSRCDGVDCSPLRRKNIARKCIVALRV